MEDVPSGGAAGGKTAEVAGHSVVQSVDLASFRSPVSAYYPVLAPPPPDLLGLHRLIVVTGLDGDLPVILELRSTRNGTSYITSKPALICSICKIIIKSV